MATYLVTVKFTQQGITHIKDTCQRAAAVREVAQTMGVRVQEIYWTVGAIDGALILEAPDDETVSALMLQVGSRGFVHTQTMRAFTSGEMEKIVAKVKS